MSAFVGRRADLRRLEGHLTSVGDTGEGILLSIRGRRQVGKSRLVEEFLRVADVPSVFFTAARGSATADELSSFAAEVMQSTLAVAPLFAETRFATWEAALRLIAANISTPSVVVIDELPFLIEGDAAIEGLLQRVWDRYLSRVPALLIVIGSDLSMMESLGRYDRPLYQRMREMVVDPLNPAETAEMLRQKAADALDAYLVHGGFPTLASAWTSAVSVAEFIANQLEDSTSPLIVVGERILNAEFPPDLQSRVVLEAIGAGQRKFGDIGRAARISQGSLSRTLQALVNDKRVVAVDRPMSAKPSRDALYYVADPYLRFWLRFIGPRLELLLRDRGDVLAAEIRDRWKTYRGQAIEPLIRASVERLLPDEKLGDARYVGSFWTRTGDVEVDVVGGHDAAAPTDVAFVGSIKWRSTSAFDRRDMTDLAASRAYVPGATTARLLGVSRSGFDVADLDLALGPAELVSAWARP